MTKSTITKAWITGLIILLAGLVLGGVSLGLMVAFPRNLTPAPSGNGYVFTPILNELFWTTLALMILGFTVAAVGGIVQLAAWIEALVNTYQLADKTWFAVLLASGLLGVTIGLLGFVGMVAYLIAGPDGMSLDRMVRSPQIQTYMPAPTPASEPNSQPPTFAHVG